MSRKGTSSTIAMCLLVEFAPLLGQTSLVSLGVSIRVSFRCVLGVS